MASSQSESRETAVHRAPLALARLLHHRWALPILAQVAKDKGCKFVTISKRLDVRAERLKPALRQLAELDLVVPNPGYGHPMRSEYVLGELGYEVADPSLALWRWILRTDVERTALKKWPLPTLAAVAHGAHRFNEIQEVLSEAAPRAVTLALKDLIAIELITRQVDASFPPAPQYNPAKRALTVLRHVDALSHPLAQAHAA